MLCFKGVNCVFFECNLVFFVDLVEIVVVDILVRFRWYYGVSLLVLLF